MIFLSFCDFCQIIFHMLCIVRLGIVGKLTNGISTVIQIKVIFDVFVNVTCWLQTLLKHRKTVQWWTQNSSTQFFLPYFLNYVRFTASNGIYEHHLELLVTCNRFIPVVTAIIVILNIIDYDIIDDVTIKKTSDL